LPRRLGVLDLGPPPLDAGGSLEDDLAGGREAYSRVLPRWDLSRELLPFLIELARARGCEHRVALGAQRLGGEAERVLPRAAVLERDGRALPRLLGHQLARAPPHVLRSGVILGDGSQRLGVVDPHERAERELHRAIAHGDAAERRRVGEAVERFMTDRQVRSVSDDVPQQAIAGDPRQGRPADARMSAPDRDGGEARLVGHARERRLAFGGRRARARDADQQVARARGRQITQRRLHVVGRDRQQEIGAVELLDGDPPHVRIDIVAGDLAEAVLVLGAELANGGGPDLGIGMAPPRAQTLEEVHRPMVDYRRAGWRLNRSP
jgi:hypothetical protein